MWPELARVAGGRTVIAEVIKHTAHTEKAPGVAGQGVFFSELLEHQDLFGRGLALVVFSRPIVSDRE